MYNVGSGISNKRNNDICRVTRALILWFGPQAEKRIRAEKAARAAEKERRAERERRAAFKAEKEQRLVKGSPYKHIHLMR